MILVALDLATNVGACWGAPDRLPTLLHHRLPSTGDDVGAFLAAFEDWFVELLDAARPDEVCFEAPVLPRAKFNRQTKKVEGGVSLITTRKLQGLAGEVERICFRRQLVCTEAQPAEVKKALTGKGNATKGEMVRACRAFGLSPFTYVRDGEEASDEADGFGVWLARMRIRCPEHRAFWEAPAPLIDGVVG